MIPSSKSRFSRRLIMLLAGAITLALIFMPLFSSAVMAQENQPPEPTPESGETPPDAPGEFPPPPQPDRQPASRSGAYFYVNALTGDDSRDCTSNTDPCLTIGRAISQASDGDLINISSGTYNENLTGITKELVFEGSGVNETIVNGGGINSVFTCTSGKSLTFVDMTITNGISTNSAGGIHTNGPLTLTRVAVTGNSTNTGLGGGVFVENVAIIQDVSITYNQTSYWGGGIVIKLAAGQTATLERVTISGNTVNGIGYSGGMHLIGEATSVAYLTNVTISGNYAYMGGALGISGNASASLNSVTIASNTGDTNSGTGAVLNYGSLNFFNTIVAYNQPFNCTSTGTLTSQDYNIDSGTTCGFSNTKDQSNTDPSLSALADNGGYTYTHALPQTSPAVDTGAPGCPSYDQRGLMRFADGNKDQANECDVGAYEYRFPSTTGIVSHYPNPSLPGQQVKVSVNVTSAYLSATGQVQISGASTNCTATLSGGTGYCYVVFNSSGTKTLTASYPGDLHNDPSAKSISHTVRTVTTKTFSPVATQDGYILESGEFTNSGGVANSTLASLKLGDNSQDRQYRSIIGFYTASIPDNAVITSVELKVKKASFTGTNPFTTHGTLWVDMQKGAFSNNNALQLADFNVTANRQTAGKIPNAPVSNWYTMTLSSGNYTYLNKTGTTQFRLRFTKDDNDDLGNDFISFHSGNATTAANRPQLIVKYYVP